MRVAFQGEPGAYSEEAIFEHFGPVDTLPCESFEAVFDACSQLECDSGVIPIENSLAGSIHQNYDLLLRRNLWITGEHFLRVRHCLITLPGVQKSDLSRVISHPQALSQCAAYLRGLPGVRVESVYDTAGSVKLLRQTGDRACAAIASRRAAEIYMMHILDENIEDDPQNFTRFLVIAKNQVFPQEPAKTSIVFSLRNEPGALFKALSVFALRDIDLTKIESRPLVGSPWEYLFYIDFSGASSDENPRRALDHLGEYATMLRLLGSYPRQREPDQGNQ
jgi:prephenate dehydratase